MAVAADILVFVSVILAVVFSMMIVHEVSKRGHKINFYMLRLHFIKHLGQYKRLTREETGKVGSLYYLCIGSYVMALVFVIVHLVAG